jgi:hypothetical protein
MVNTLGVFEHAEHALFAKAAGVVEIVAKGHFHRDYVRTQPFTQFHP